MKLFTTSNPKILKGEKLAKPVRTLVLHLIPHTLNGLGVNLCPGSTSACRRGCINVCGHGGMTRKDGTNTCHNARLARTTLFLTGFQTFKEQIVREIVNHVRYCNKRGLRAAVRLNGTSDINFADIFRDVMEAFPRVSFYDYTKVSHYWIMWHNGEAPKNYHLTYSMSETPQSHAFAARVLNSGNLVACVVKATPKQALPSYFNGFKAIDGDRHDYRPDDAHHGGAYVLLRAKGPMRKAWGVESGFVHELSVAATKTAYAV